jgi:uracil-DNA glycosylase
MGKSIEFAGVKIKVHESWNDFWNNATISCLGEIQGRIGANFTPEAAKVFLFLNFDLSRLKVVILGQDPYPQAGVATGRAFEVGNIKTWYDLKKNNSLQNILKSICHNSLKLGDIPTIDEIRKNIRHRKFNILSPRELFINWENQGVLLLNTAFTCEIGKPNSHSNYWNCFSQRVVDYIAVKRPDAEWFLWGNRAKSFGARIPESQKHESTHPRLNTRTEDSFFAKNHFSLDLGIKWTGKTLNKES